MQSAPTAPSPRAATHDGTCQICGARQRLPGGLLAKHGYDVQHGFFNGVCIGSDHAPFEEDCLLLARTLGDFRTYVAREAAALAALQARTPDPADVTYPHRDVILRGPLSARPDGVYITDARTGKEARVQVLGTPESAAERLHRELIGSAEVQLRMSERDLQRMQARLQGWAPAPLLPLTPRGGRPADQPKAPRAPTKKELAVAKYQDGYRAKYGREPRWDAHQTVNNNDLLREADYLMSSYNLPNGTSFYSTEKERRVMMTAFSALVNHEGEGALLAHLSALLGAPVALKGHYTLTIDGQDKYAWVKANAAAHAAACRKSWA